MSRDTTNKIRIPAPVVRNWLVPLVRMRRAGAHGKRWKALRREARQALLSGSNVE